MEYLRDAELASQSGLYLPVPILTPFNPFSIEKPDRSFTNADQITESPPTALHGTWNEIHTPYLECSPSPKVISYHYLRYMPTHGLHSS